MLKSHVEDGNMLITRLTASLIAALTYKQNCIGGEDYSVVQFIVWTNTDHIFAILTRWAPIYTTNYNYVLAGTGDDWRGTSALDFYIYVALWA